MRSPLHGVRVIELSTMITRPPAGMLLADLGADVIKIENRHGGDPFRSHHGGLDGGHFLAYNRNKRSLTLDLRSPQGKAILIVQGDVLIDNFRPRVLDRLGFAWDILRERNPRLIHASITGFGKDGPYRGPTLLRCGIARIVWHVVPVHRPQCTAARRAHAGGQRLRLLRPYGVLGAIYAREKTGKGCRIETSMLEATASFARDAFVNYRRHNADIGPLSRVRISQSHVFQCQDGRCVAIHLSSRTKFLGGAAGGAGPAGPRRAF